MRKSKILFLATLSLFLSACGGGSSSSAPSSTVPTPQPTSPEGVYSGTLTGSTSKNFTMVILENGDTWTLYGTETVGANIVAGFVQGTVTWTNTMFTSSNAKDFGASPATSGTISGNYNSSTKTVSGTVSDGKGALSFSGSTPTAVTYNYSTPAELSKITGVWALKTYDGASVLMNISSAGVIEATSNTGSGANRCLIDGTIKPRPSGKNIFNVSLTFAGSTCKSNGLSANGIAVSYPIANNKTELLITGVDSARTVGTVAFGSK